MNSIDQANFSLHKTATMTSSPSTNFTSIYHVSPRFLAAFIIFILSTITYLDVLNHQFISYDDNRIILARSDTFDDFSLKNIKDIIVNDYPREEPLIIRDLSYLMNGSIFGAQNPQGYVLGNLLLHMIASYLIFALSLVLFPERYWQAILTAVLFAVHPIHVEGVAWISSRKDTLYSVFFLASLLSYSRFVKSNSLWALTVSLVLYLLALFSKSSAIAFVPMVFLYRFLLVSQKKWRWPEVAYFILLTIFSLLFMQWYARILTNFGLFEQQNGVSLFKESPSTWLLLNMEAITFYMGKLLYPETLSIIYDFPAPRIIFKNLPYLLLSLTTCTVLIFMVLKFIKITDQRPLFLALWFFVALGPYMNWAGIKIFVADRYLYLAAFAPFVAVSYGIATITTMIRQRHRVGGSLVVVLTCLLIMTLMESGIRAVRVWSDTPTLWSHVLKTAPLHVEPYNGLLNFYLNIYENNRSTQVGMEAIANAKAIANQGYQKYCKNKIDNCPPQLFGVLYFIAKIYYEEDNMDKAEQFLQQALWLKPDDIRLSHLHSYLAIKQNEYKTAQEDIEFIKAHANPHEHAGILSDITLKIAPLLEEKLKGQ